MRGVRDRRIVVFFYGSMAAALAVGALQMFRVQGGWLTDYGADLFGTAWLYAMFRQGRTIFRRGRPLSPGAAASVVFLGCTASEIAQRGHRLPGVFDPADIVVYAAAVAACLTLDRWLGPLAPAPRDATTPDARESHPTSIT